MDKSHFTEICRASYGECRDFWEEEFDPIMPENFEISGKTSRLSSVEVVTFIAEIEERLSKEGVEISFIDHFMDIDNSSVNIELMYKILQQCSA